MNNARVVFTPKCYFFLMLMVGKELKPSLETGILILIVNQELD